VPLPDDVLALLSDVDRDRVARIEAFMRDEFGYIAIQSTRPQTLDYGLIDSPVGQLARIMDKFRKWTRPREILPNKIIDRDRLLTDLMIYWLTGTAASASQPPRVALLRRDGLLRVGRQVVRDGDR
jgi:epoxide hydrolase